MSKINKDYRPVVEFRAIENEEGQPEKMRIEGRAIVFNSPTKLYTIDGVDYYEVIDREAFANCDMRDCCLKYNHVNSSPILARTRGNSLNLEIREDGVYFNAELFNTSFSRDCFELIRQGALQCSFAFIIAPDGAEYDRATHTRTVKQIDRLMDIAVVTLPAYEDTWVTEARSIIDLDREMERLESEKRAENQRRMALIARTII